MANSNARYVAFPPVSSRMKMLSRKSRSLGKNPKGAMTMVGLSCRLTREDK